MAKIKGVRNLKVFDPFFIAHFIASPVAQLIRSERFYLEASRVYLFVLLIR